MNGSDTSSSQKSGHTAYFFKGTEPVSVVLLHGWSSYPRQVEPLAEELNKQGFTVAVPRLKGHDSEPEYLEGATWEDWIEDARQAVLRVRARFPDNKIVLGGMSMGGNLAIIASQLAPVDGIFLLGTPIVLKKHLIILIGSWLLPWVRKYQKKRYPARVQKEKELLGYTSYQRFPTMSIRHMLNIVHLSTRKLRGVTAPLLIMQNKQDYLITRISPYVIYYSVRSNKKQLYWLQSDNSQRHIIITNNTADLFERVSSFINEI